MSNAPKPCVYTRPTTRRERKALRAPYCVCTVLRSKTITSPAISEDDAATLALIIASKARLPMMPTHK